MNNSLVDFSKYPKLNFSSESKFKIKWDINKIALVGFIIFTIFFLYNCKYGIFKWKNPQYFSV